MRLHVVDGTFELFRAHFSKRPEHTAPDGMPVKAALGVASSLLALLNERTESVTHLAVAFDNPIRSFRNELFAGYKSDEGVLPELRAQFDLVEEATRALGIVCWSMDRFEADDALASAAQRFSPAVEQVRLLTPDKDLGQCLRGQQVVLVDRIRGRELDEVALRAARGITPESVPDLLALMGDAADGYPGLPGFGEKTAGALLATYLHLEAIPRSAGAWDPKIRGRERLAAVLSERLEEALLYRRLATLVTDVPIAETLEDLRFRGVPRQRFEAFCERVGSRELAARAPSWL